jgi:hypothetical protein
MTTVRSYKLDSKRHPGLAFLSATLRANHRFAADSVDRGIALFGEAWATEFEKVVSSLFPDAEAIAAAATGYATFAMQSMRLQAAFEKERQYKIKTHEQASSEVNFNEKHMMQEYLPGLLLSHFLWPHHYRQLQFFDSAFVQAMRVANASTFLEVGIGTGLYSGLLLRRLPEIKGVGLDISTSSKKFTEAQMGALGVDNRYHVELRDVTATSIEPKADWLVCVEVLSQLIEAGFTLEQSFVGAAYKPSSLGVPVPEAAAFIVF